MSKSQNQNHLDQKLNIINENEIGKKKEGDDNDYEKEKIPIWVIYLMIIMMIITGSINTIANKLQSISISLDKKYNHNWFITFCMFLGEVICLFVYYGFTYIDKKKVEKNNNNSVSNYDTIDENQNQKKENQNLELNFEDKNSSLPEASPYQLLLPALCDFFGSTIMTIGLGLIASSVYQMLRGSLILFTTLLSYIFLKTRFARHNYYGIFLVVFGLTLVGISSLQNSMDNSSNNALAGFFFVIFAQIFTAVQFILEENFMKNYKCPPLKAVGWEGVWGSIFYIIFLFIAQNIKCPVTNSKNDFFRLICTENDKGIWLLEDSLFALRQLANNSSLAAFCILYICSIGLFNFVGISISKHLSSPARAVIDTIRTIVVWVFFLMPIVDPQDRETFMWLELFGFVFLIIGTLIYNEILIVPNFDSNNNTEEKNEKDNIIDNVNFNYNNDEKKSLIEFNKKN
jgi:drug/metabolite transporter (DMT)-like permease